MTLHYRQPYWPAQLLLLLATISFFHPDRAIGQALDVDADNSTEHGFALGTANRQLPDAAGGTANPGFGLSTPLTVDPLFGSSTTSVPIIVPPGRKNATPEVILRYSSSATNGPFGVGWDLSLGAVQRDTRKGVPISGTSYDDAYGFVLTFPRGTILLDRCLDGQQPSLCNSWGSQVEEIWVSAQFDRAANQWRVKDKSGIQYTFGATGARTGWNVNSNGGTFGWFLTRIDDPNANRIVVQYTSPDLVSGANPFAYLDQIDYGGNRAAGYSDIFHVKVTYQSGRQDAPASYKGGFAARATMRADSIKVWADTGSFSSTNPNRKYRLAYQQDPDTGVSQLYSVGLDVPGETSPPDTTFTYETKPNGLNGAANAVFDFMPTVKARSVLQQFEANPSRIKSGFLDVNGDHLPDFLDGYSGNEAAGLVLYLNKGGYTFQRQNNGAVWTSLTHRLSYDGSSTGFERFLDITGDGLPDLVTQGSGTTACTTSATNQTCSWSVYPNIAGQISPTALSWPGVPTALLGKFPNPIQRTAAASQQAQLIDLNGDGLPDLIHCGAWTAAQPYCDFRRNLGTTGSGGTLVGLGFAAATSWYVPNIPSEWFDDPLNKMASGPNDIWDTLRWGPLAASVGDGQSNQGGADFNDNCFLSQIYGYHLLKTIVDINGDGLPDLVSSGEPTQFCIPCTTQCCGFPNCASGRTWSYTNSQSLLPWQVAYNTGAGFTDVDPAGWQGTERRSDIPYLDYTRFTNSGTVSLLEDVNGDSLPDYVNFIDNNQDWEVGINTGDHFTGNSSSRPTWSNIGSNRALIDKAPPTGAYDGKVRSTLLDLDGDGIIDRVTVVGTTSVFFQVQPGKPPRANLLKRIDTGVGSSWEATYVAAAESGAALPFPVWTVNALTARSGLTGNGHVLTTNYTFTGPFFEAATREFRGFRASTETRVGDGRKTARSFDQPLLPNETGPLSLAPFKLLSQETRDSTSKLLLDNSTKWTSVTVATTGGVRQRIRPQTSTRTVYGSTPSAYSRQVRTFDAYDQYNNVTSVTVTGSVSRGTVDTSTLSTTVVTYTTDIAKAILDRPLTVTVKESVSGSLVQRARREYVYDPSGNVTDVLDWLDNDAQRGGGARTVTSMHLAYETGLDAAATTGLPTLIQTGWGNGQSVSTKVRYTCNSGLYPCTVTNAFDHVTSRTYDIVHGGELSITDPNGGTTTYAYDGFGRLKSVTEPLDPVDGAVPDGPQRESTKLTYVSGAGATPGYVKTQQREPGNATGYSTEVEFFDGLGRHLETKLENEVDGTAEVTTTGAVLFDAAGRIRRQAVPFMSMTALTAFDSVADTQAAVQFSYDSADRVRTTITPDGNSAETLYDTGGGVETHDGNYVACAADPLAPNASCPGKKTIQLYDPFGRVVESSVYRGASTLIRKVTKAYDVLGHLTSDTTKDSAGNTGQSQITYTYDSLGRRLTMSENDSGLWRYVYDDAGNLISQDDPRTSQHVEVCFDQLNRPVGESAVSTDTFSQNPCAQTPNRAQYLYDGATNGKGRLWEALGPKTVILSPTPVTAATTTVLEYDKRGREVRLRKSLAPGGGTARSFTWTYTYDVNDRLTKVNYPTDSVDEDLFLFYNSVGRLRSAYTVGNIYLQNAVYDRFGRILRQQFGDGSVQDKWVYSDTSANLRLNQILVTNGTAPALQDFQYGPYDRAGNLLKITDQTTTYTAESARDNDWTYTYWGEGRLSTAKKGTSGVTASFTYDYLDNMTAGNLGFPAPGASQSMPASSTKPHQISSVTPPGVAPTYQANGGLKSRPATVTGDLGKTQIDYDAAGRVERVTMSDGTVVEYAYDHEGQIVAKAVNDTDVTLYYDGLFEVRGGTLTRHFYSEDRRIALSITNAPAGLTLAANSGGTAPGSMLAIGPSGSPVSVVLSGSIMAGLAAIGTAFLFAMCWGAGPLRVSFVGKVRRGWVASLCVIVTIDIVASPIGFDRLGMHPSRAEASCTGDGGATTYSAYFVHPDHLNSASMLTASRKAPDGSPVTEGAPVEYYRYGAYGKPAAYTPAGTAVTSGSEKTDVLYTGQPWDSRAQLYRFPGRLYDPQLARFVSLDAVVEGRNSYAYVQWNPVNRIDPSGFVDIDNYQCGPLGSVTFCGVIDGPSYPFSPAFPIGEPGRNREVTFAQSIDTTLRKFHGYFENRATMNFENGDYPGYAVDLIPLSFIPGDLRSLQIDLVLTVATVGLSEGLRAEYRYAKAVQSIRRAARLGREGEEAVVAAVGSIGRKVRIPGVGVPDGLTKTVLSEVKNKAKQGWTKQLRQYAEYAQENKLRFDLYVDPNTILSRNLLEARNRGLVNIIDTIPLRR